MSNLEANLRQSFREKTGKDPCEFQIQTYKARKDGKHVVLIAPTGSGKTLPMIASVLLEETGITIVTSALNVISDQIGATLLHLGAVALVLHGKRITPEQKKADCSLRNLYN
jgi:ATP-dependent helicase YprA (DUF1998 family)